VEAIFEGEEEQLRHMLDWCRTGPPGARVLGVEARWGPSTRDFENFSVRR
jgi:acylphosphatase